MQNRFKKCFVFMISCSYSTGSSGSWTATNISASYSTAMAFPHLILSAGPLYQMFWLLKFVCNEFYKLAHYLNAKKRLENYLTHFLFGREGLRGRFFGYESRVRKRKIRQTAIIFLSKVLQYTALRKRKKKKYFSMQSSKLGARFLTEVHILLAWIQT